MYKYRRNVRKNLIERHVDIINIKYTYYKTIVGSYKHVKQMKLNKTNSSI